MKYIPYILIFLFACSPQFHYRKILKKDPSFFKVDTVTQISIKHIPPVSFKYKPIPLDTFVFIDEKDSVKVRVITLFDTTQVIDVNCPDTKIIEKFVPEPYPIYLPLTFLQKVRMYSKGAGIFLFIIIAGFLLFQILKRFKKI